MNRIITFLREVRAELRKVTWPTQHQMVLYTGVVLGLCLFIALFLGGINSLAAWVVARLVGN